MVQFDGVGRRIIAAVKEQIDNGTYVPGDRLPSSRAFAAEWGASRTTVTAAYSQLIAEGYLISRPGARLIVAPGLAARTNTASLQLPVAKHLSGFAKRLLSLQPPAPSHTAKVADFRYGDLSGSDFPVLAWRRALNKVSLQRKPRLRYADPQGDAELRTALQSYLWRARGIACSPEEIVIVNGSQQGLDLCARLLLDPGDRFLIENPGYTLARNAFAAVGGVGIPIPVDRDGLCTIDLPPGRLVYVTPSHQFPLGGVLTAARRRRLLDWAQASGAYVIEDDYDGEYQHDIMPIPPLHTLDPQSVIYVGTFSKTLSPTLRLGYLIVPAGLGQAFSEAKRLTDRHTTLLEQEALADILTSGVYERHVRNIRRRNAERRTVLLEALQAEFGDAVTIEGAQTGLHMVMWLRNLPAAREAEFAAAVLANGVGLYPVSPLYDESYVGPGQAGFVIGYACVDHDSIAKGVGVISQTLSDLD